MFAGSWHQSWSLWACQQEPVFEILHEAQTQRKEAVCRKKKTPNLCHYYFSGSIHLHKTYSHSHQPDSSSVQNTQMQNLPAQNTAHHFCDASSSNAAVEMMMKWFLQHTGWYIILMGPQFLFKQKGLWRKIWFLSHSSLFRVNADV